MIKDKARKWLAIALLAIATAACFAACASSVKVESVTVTGAQQVVAGKTSQYTASVLPAEAENKAVTWSVTNGTGSATIDGNGLLTAQTAGSVTVVAAAKDGSEKTGSLDVTIVAAGTITVTGESEVPAGEEATYQASYTGNANAEFTWSVTPGTGSAEIDQNGVLTAGTAGTVEVVATTDGQSGSMSVTITENDKALGLPRPQGGTLQMIATAANTIFIPNVWRGTDDVTITEARNVVDIGFTPDTPTATASAFLDVPNDIDISKTEYFGIKFKGNIAGEDSLKPMIDIQVKDMYSGYPLFLDQVTNIDLSAGNEYGGAPHAASDTVWVAFKIDNRYRLTADRKIVIELIPNTIADKSGTLTVIDVCFFGNKAAETTETLVSAFKAPHWEANDNVTSRNVVATGSGEGLEAAHTELTFNQAAATAWTASPAWIYNNISRYTTVTMRFAVSNINASASDKVSFQLFYGDNQTLTGVADAEDTGISIRGAAITVTDTAMHEVTFEIPEMTEQSHFMNRAFNIKMPTVAASSGKGVLDIYAFELSGDRDPIGAAVSNLAGEDVAFTANMRNSWSEGGTIENITEGNVFKGWKLTAAGGADLKIQWNNRLPDGTTFNAFKFTITGPAGITANVQSGWSSGWTTDPNKSFTLTGERQEIEIYKAGTLGTGYSFEITFSGAAADAVIEMTDVRVGVVYAEEEALKEGDIAANYITAAGAADSMSFAVENGVAQITVADAAEKNQIVAFFANGDLQYKNTLKFTVSGAENATIEVYVAYGLQFNRGEEAIVTLTGGEQTVSIDIVDRDALKTDKLSIQIVFETEGEYTVSSIAFTATEGN